MDTDLRNDRIAASRFAYQVRALQFLLTAHMVRGLLAKAGFRPDQPRVPRGNPDGGQWTDAPGWAGSGGSDTLIGDPDDDDFTDADDFDSFDMPDVSAIPLFRPDSLSERYGAIRTYIIPPFVIMRPKAPPSTILQKIGVPKWVREYYPHIDAYMSPAKTLRELQTDARFRKVGHDRHHRNERIPALREGFPRSLVDGADNLVSIPRFKHWEVTAWFATRNKVYQGLSPREYLRGRDWEEKNKVGLDALREAGVLR